MIINNRLRDAALATPDPERAQKNIGRLHREAPQVIERHERQLEAIASLFSYSQFLADYSIKNPESLSFALEHLDTAVDRQSLVSDSHAAFSTHIGDPISSLRQKALEFLRETKKRNLLRITIRDLVGTTALGECMAELSTLAEAMTETALHIAEFILRERFGFMRDNTFSVIGLGKLGAGELNYSSDIDIVTLYRSENRQSTGILTPYGIRTNRIEAGEYFSRLTETMTTLLQSHTEDGMAYRVDLRLRPNGRKGPLSLSLEAYASYYEAWGKTWERIALIRAKPIAGDMKLGEKFSQTVEPFVWKKSLDYHDIEEIRELKKKIDTVFDANDIKRGYGGIREIEFFTQTFQLLYGGERTDLRTGTIPAVLGKLQRESLLPDEEVKILSESYLFLRRLEHILQMRDDVQTHSLPSKPEEIAILARKLHFGAAAEFVSGLKLRRVKVKDIYNSLLGSTEDTTQEKVLSLREELPEDAVREYLEFKGFRDAESASRNIDALSEQISTGKTIRERTLLRQTIPSFLEHIMKSTNKDRALSMLAAFIPKVGNHESYLDLFLQRNDTKEMIVTIFSRSTYLTRLLLSLDNLETLFEYPDAKMDYRSLEERLNNLLAHASDPFDAVREFRKAEELKSGMLFLKQFLDVYGLSGTLSAVADAAIRTLVRILHAQKGFGVIGLGGFGARELNMGSDLDLLFIGRRNVSSHSAGKGPAQELIRLLSEYTSKGFAYKVDMRLRPDGSKGILVNNIEGYTHYYLKSARLWEIQSLLRARPIAGDMHLLRAFQEMKRRIITQRGSETRGADMRDMRRRIIREVSHERSGFDLKNGPGGIKEIEFLIQYLQLRYSKKFPDLIVSGIRAAVKRLVKYGILDRASETLLLTSHWFLRTVDTLLRLNETDVLKPDSELVDIIVVFLGLGSGYELTGRVQKTRQRITQMAERVYKRELS